MLTRQEQIFQNQPVSVASGDVVGTTFTSRPITWGNEAGWVLIVRMGTPTGTTPSLQVEVDLSDNGGAYTRVGGAITAYSTAGTYVTAYATGTTQGAIVPSPAAGHTYNFQVKATLANADNVIPNVFIDLVALN